VGLGRDTIVLLVFSCCTIRLACRKMGKTGKGREQWRVRQSRRRGELELRDTSRVNTGMALIEGAFEGIQVGVVRVQILYTAVYPVVVERRGYHYNHPIIN
jgi:hypothetical protein